MIKVGFCVSYDWVLLKKSLPRVYAQADKICLSIDKNRKSWNGQKYSFDEEAFQSWLSGIDTRKKIDLYEDDFSLSDLSAMQNDTRQRMLMAQRLGRGGWHIQVDSDEYFLDFDLFVRSLKKIHTSPTGNEKPLNVCACWISLIKRLPSGYLFVDFKSRMPELVPMATNVPAYERARHNGHFNVVVPVYVLHETWARSDDELWFKMNNWGHAGDELKQREFKASYYNLWKSLDEYNYPYISDFHPASPRVWPGLGFMKADSVESLINEMVVPPFPLSGFDLLMRNNRNIARIKHLFSKFF